MRRTRSAQRWLMLTSVGAATALALTACAGSAETPSTAPTLSDEPVTLTFTWWGNDVRHGITEELIAAFEAEHENITIEPQFTDWAGYWDKLATTVAAGDAPDIIQMDEKQLSTYAANGVLLDLGTLGEGLPTSDFPEAVLGTGALDGTQYGVPVGINTYTYMANADVLADLGIELPDDETWTWDDLNAIAEEVSAAGGGTVVGSQSWGFEDGGLNNWLRQNGESLFAEDGSPEVAATEATLAAWWQNLLDVTEAGGTPEPSATIERESAGLAESFTATNQSAFGPWWSNQVAALREASGQNLVPLRVPTLEGGDDGAAYYKPSMFWSASAKTEHPGEVALFLDFLANSEEAADLLLAERGVPANEKIREYITPKLDEVNQEVVDFLDLIAPRVGDAPPATPPGGGAIETIIDQQTQRVLFGEATPEQAAADFIEELQRALDDAAI
ncbi:multiple sugar transport system substrate-binding protein [Microbacterium terrae]|uniref:ABC transporter substrate-binding protein YesO n=1 Tax=Microbacterium terrae TaxID=69369 RepID=A0A0M2H262_9MICO|nr:extracellular solute-binding protein [Microbacterium terrae]KJL37658.1 putative ABC transporter substrate-binding protein YesO [Microbacterium terrae]MBP1076490.1 multiple sugar transport system substrate-binding protein [Microbacterium terrae]GLJ97319.1 sugar ABC transporter substrate-binding protein [Microbacterium terrae]